VFATPLLDCALPICPITWPALLVGHGHDDDFVFARSIVDAERKALEHDASCAMESDRIAVRRFGDPSKCSGQFVKETSSGQETAFLIPRLSLVGLVTRLRMKASAHSAG